MKLTRKQDYIFIIFAVVLIIAFVIVAIIVTFGEIGSGKKPAPIQTTKTSPRIKYESGSLGKALVKLTTRTPLSPSDQAVKDRLLNQAGEGGVINKTNNYSIEYIRAMDDIEVEILTTNIDQAKTEAQSYLKSQGFSSQGLCNLPVRFYLNYVVTKKLPKDTVFNPLAEGC